MTLTLIASLFLAVSAITDPSPIEIPADPLATLKLQHPRIMATAADFMRLKENLKNDPQASQMAQAVIRQADNDLKKPLPIHVLPDGKRLLSTSREVKNRMQTLGMAWQLTGDRKYPERAWKDLEAAGNFPDWNPPHFLDTAEMTRAFAVGFDWMYDEWTPAQREKICQWIISQGLAPAMKGYSDSSSKNGHQLRSLNNWGQVCDSGIGMGALAIADLHPEEAREPLRYALEYIQPSLSQYAPDGGWAEGYGYYGYAMEYTTGFLSSLDCSLGTDFGLSKIPGFSFSPDFPTYLEGPCGSYFGFADCGERDHKISSLPWTGWASMQFDNPVSAENQRKKAGTYPDAMGLLWLPPAMDHSKISASSRVKQFSNVGCATMRTKWGDTNAGFVGFKGGDNKVNHSHLDIGSFVYDVDGKHWAVDLGADNYNLPGYFGKNRWDYYRLRAEGNNTLVVNPDHGPDQSPKASCPLTLCIDHGDASVVVGDLSAAYPLLAAAQRGIRLANNGSLRIQDELDTGGKEATLFWFMHTPAKITISQDEHSATLKQEGKTLRANLISPTEARFESEDAVPLPTSPNPTGQLVNNGITKLVVRSTFKNKETLVVDLAPEMENLIQLPVTPLSNW